MKQSWFKILVWIVCFQVIGLLLGLLTKGNIYPWYASLTKSNLTPPPVVFSIVWPILYSFLAITGYNLWQQRKIAALQSARYCYIIQLLMNWAWTLLFFQFHWIGFGFLWIVILTFLTALLIYRLNDTLREMSILLIPYLLWLVFAAYLNGVVWMLN